MSRDNAGQAERAIGAVDTARDLGAAPASLLDTAPYRIEGITLVVRDLAGVARFYRDVIGLTTISQDAHAVRLGVGAKVLLELRHDPAARPWSPREAGLYHTAFLLPRRGDLGAWLAHAADRGIRLSGGADHLVSEAVYLTDPEGNGIEIYVDRPVSTWPKSDDGTVVMSNAPLDYAGLVRAAPRSWSGMPAGGRVGHVHLQVGQLAPAERFYVGCLGFDVTCRYPGVTFLGAGGYHHQLAVNLWSSRGAPLRPAGSTGLAEIRLVAQPGMIDAVRLRCEGMAQPLDEDGRLLVLHDPWSTRLSLASLAEPGNP